jgi:hypothetical protein
MNKSTNPVDPTVNLAAVPALSHAPPTEPAWLRPLVDQILREAGGHASAATPFCDFSAMVRHLPMYGERTLRELVKRKIIPSVRPPGSRKLAFHIPSVEASLLRYQKGGIS